MDKGLIMHLAAEVMQLPMFEEMKVTVENSPYHREANVFEHTEMVLHEYFKLTPQAVWDTNPKSYFSGAMACIFHDVGKPEAMIEKFSEDRGHYRSFSGHAQISARMFEDWMLTENIGNLIDSRTIGHITWMIENHFPWKIKKQKKRLALRETAEEIGIDAYCSVLLADTMGRMSDDFIGGLKKSIAWIEEFKALS